MPINIRSASAGMVERYAKFETLQHQATLPPVEWKVMRSPQSTELSRPPPPGRYMSSRSVFNNVDLNGDGFLSKDELKIALRAIGRSSTDRAVAQILQSSDVDGNGVLSYAEFQKLVLERREMSLPLDGETSLSAKDADTEAALFRKLGLDPPKAASSKKPNNAVEQGAKLPNARNARSENAPARINHTR